MIHKNKYLIIVAGGIGRRMQSDTPKQFLSLSGKPILFHVFERFYAWDPKVFFILVLPEENITFWKRLIHDHNFNIPHRIVSGGKERFYSVKNGLDTLEGDSGLLGIHDGVRPLVSKELIQRLFTTAGLKGNAIPVLPVKESVRIIDNDQNRVVDRSKIRLVQTPQVFDLKLIKLAYKQKYQAEFTDDATVLEAMGETLHFVEGDPMNIKITEPSDLELASSILKSQS